MPSPESKYPEYPAGGNKVEEPKNKILENTAEENDEYVDSSIEQDTIESLNLMKGIEEKFQSLGDMELNSYKGKILEYKSIKDEIERKMSEDPVFQKVLKENGYNLDKSNDSESKENPEISDDDRTNLENAKIVVNSIKDLNKDQKKALSLALQGFKDRLKKIATELGSN